MDFRHVRAFIAVADALSVTKAAERLHISQPPLSRHLQQLEQELGTTLFVRHRQGVTLTDAGRQLLGKARILEEAASDFYEAARQAARGDTGTLRIGIAWGLWDVVNKVRVDFAERRPGVTIEARDAFCVEEGHEQLRNNALDVLFARPPFDDSMDVLEIYREPIQLVISDSSPLAGRPSVGVRDLASEPLLLWDRHIAPVLYDRILELYAGAGVRPVTIPTPGSGPYNNAGIMQVASGRGIYLCLGVPLTSPHLPSGVAVLPLRDPEATIEVCVAHRKGDASPVLAEFLECIWRVFPKEEERPTPILPHSRRAS
jgi:DNA-binding transcriptional LysR family regulator